MSITFQLWDAPGPERPSHQEETSAPITAAEAARDVTAFYEQLGRFEARAGQRPVRAPGNTWSLNGVYEAVRAAYAEQKGLVLSPDHIWLSVARVAAEHIVRNAEHLRCSFVSFQGKERIAITHPGLVRGSAASPWHEVASAFAREIASRTGPELRNLLECEFTTTRPVERVASQIVLMDAMSGYFSYEVRCISETLSGIRSVTLLGTPADWADVRRRAADLDAYGMGRWLEQLQPFLDEFARASEGHPDLVWWRGLFRRDSTPGTDLDGHLRVLFPTDLAVQEVLSLEEIPDGVSRVPVVWDDGSGRHQMRFWAGIPYATVNEAGAAVPAASWAVEWFVDTATHRATFLKFLRWALAVTLERSPERKDQFVRKLRVWEGSLAEKPVQSLIDPSEDGSDCRCMLVLLTELRAEVVMDADRLREWSAFSTEAQAWRAEINEVTSSCEASSACS